MADDVFKDLANHIVKTNFVDIPKDCLEKTKMNILDSLGTLIAGSFQDGCETVANLVKEWGGKEESTILIHGGRVPAHSAALVNAMMARALDFDDAQEKGIHPSACVVPTAVAVSEKQGGVRGEELLTAVTLGNDIACRVAASTLDFHGFDPTTACGIFGTTAVAGKLLGLNENQMWNALGLALNESSGTFQSNVDRVLSVRLNQGLVAYKGILSANFAQKGITGVRNIASGVYGYYHLYSNDKAELEHLTVDLGKSFYGNTILFKRWPSCAATLTATDLVVECVDEGLRPEDVKSIEVIVGRPNYNLVGSPFNKESVNPQVEAQFSLQYTIANALLRKSPKIIHFTRDYILDDKVQEMVDKIKVTLDPDLSSVDKYNLDDRFKTILYVNLTNGDKIIKEGHLFKGHPKNHPLSMDDLINKFRENALFIKNEQMAENMETVIDYILNLENKENINSLIPLLLS